MEELDGSAVLQSKYWHSDFGEELMSELLDDEAAAPPVHAERPDDDDEGPRRRQESMVNRLISTVYSGPTISDIESALSFTGGDHLAVDARKYDSSPVVFSPEKVLSKMENKYTLKIKTCGNGLAEDGYKWRKYGQKSIKNSPNPRSYYRCTNPRCNAKKQVERATDEADTLLVTYEGLHLHYTYSPHLLLHDHNQQQQQQQHGGGRSSSSSLPKKPKLHPPISDDGPAASAVMAMVAAGGQQQQQVVPSAACCFDEEEGAGGSATNGGLLEDVVPLLVRRPCSSSGSGSSSDAGAGAAASSPSSLISTSSVSWNPTSPYIDMAILSNIF